MVWSNHSLAVAVSADRIRSGTTDSVGVSVSVNALIGRKQVDGYLKAFDVLLAQRIPIHIPIDILPGLDAQRVGLDVAAETGVVVSVSVLAQPPGFGLHELPRQPQVHPCAGRPKHRRLAERLDVGVPDLGLGCVGHH